MTVARRIAAPTKGPSGPARIKVLVKRADADGRFEDCGF